MKDIVITSKSLRRELWILLGCIVAGVLVDVYAIIRFDRPFSELFQTVGYILFIALVLYLVIALLRLLISAVRRLLSRK